MDMTNEAQRSVSGDDRRPQDLHLLVIGGGSAAFAAALRAQELGARVTLINHGLPIGGTCVNVGCVPSKTLIRAAEAHYRAAHPRFDGIDSSSRITDFNAIIAQKETLTRELQKVKYVDVINDLDKVDVIDGHATFLGPRSVSVNGKTIHADRILIATGASPFVPPIPGVEDVDYLTSTTAMELTHLPESLIILGGGYIALELGQMFSRLGTKVTLLQRSERILPSESADITLALTGYLDGEGVDIVTGVSLHKLTRFEKGVQVSAAVHGETQTFSAERVLVATGRKANTDTLDLAKAGVQTQEDGSVRVNEYLETSAAGVYASGDVVGDYLYVYAAAYEGSLAAENALSGNVRKRDYAAIPWVVFTDPQLAGVGMDEHEARENGFEADVSRLPLEHVPRALSARDTRGFVTLIRDKKTDHLLGARILAPEGGELVMEASLAIKYGIPVSELAQTFHPYLTMSEAIKLAAITFEKDVGSLSCCAS